MAANFSEELFFITHFFQKNYCFTATLHFPELHFLFISLQLSELSMSHVQFKCGSLFLCILLLLKVAS